MTLAAQLTEAKGDVVATPAARAKEQLKKDGKILSMWQLEDKLKRDGLLVKGQALAFFCPVYFAGQLMVRALLNKKDEQGELVLFSLPSISNEARVQLGLEQMRRLGIKDPERYLKKGKLRLYSSLPGVEGVGSGLPPAYIQQEFVQLAAFQIVPEAWLNAGDPVNETYRFPGETGYSPYWRVPPFDKFKKMRPKLAKKFRKTAEGISIRRTS